ncbi:MAG: hypothetical protein ACXVEF_06925 [Polyangiales bacterium]
MKRFALTVSAAVAVTTIVGSANAQLWLRDRNAESKGFHTGGVEIHPSFGAEIGYDSNYFNRSGKDGQPIVDTTRLRLTPSIDLRPERVPALPSITWSLGAGLIYSEFLTNTDQLGRNREVGVIGDARVNFLPGRTFGFSIFDTITRTTQPATSAEPTAGLNRIDNRAGGELIYTRKGGLFDWRWGYSYQITRFEADFAKDLDNDTHTVYTKGRFRFLPRTALTYEGSVGFMHYVNPSEGLANANTVRSMVGLNGLLTDRLNLLAQVGWGAAFYDNHGTGVRDFDSLIGQVEAKYILTSGEQAEQGAPVSSVAVGFTRGFSNSYLGNFYESDRGYLAITSLIAERFFLSATAGIGSLKYGDVLGRTNGVKIADSFRDSRIDAALFGEFRVTNWFGVNGTLTYINESSDTNIPFSTTAGPTGPTFNVGFKRYQAMIGVRAFY